MTQHPANHLAGQTSPYLLQHLHNPVDWYPWGEEALGRAREENLPIFLSVGYAACHWCHVMERESFEDPATADILNAHFVSIKVDREERPDIDEIYMSAVQLLTGSGGWPMSVFLTPELEPFFAGTYFPNESRYGMASFQEVLNRIAQLWREEPERLRGNAAELTQALRREMSRATAVDRVELEPGLLRLAENQLRGSFDPEWGGFGGAPKFPPSGALGLLLRREAEAPDPERRNMIDVTLARMARGGMYDQVGGGFARYSVDEQWLVPHFEKMLYDNALLARCYTDAWQLTQRPLYRRVARQTLDYLLRDMQDEAGGWHSAEDADSEGREGLFYLWKPGEIDTLLGPEDGAFLREFYGVSEAGNFEGANILHLPEAPKAFAKTKGLDEQALWDRIDPLRERLFQAREQRTRPGRDDKLLTAWNGMAIAALARAGRVFGEPRYLEAARRAAEFFWTEMRRDGVLLRSYRRGQTGQPGYLDDYAELALGLLELYQASFETQWLERAGQLLEEADRRFRDPDSGLFFFSAEDHAHLLVRSHSSFDGATPSGNAAIAQALLQYGWLAEHQPSLERAEALLRALSGLLRQAPRAFLNSLWALDLYLNPPWRLALVAPGGAEAARPLLDSIDEQYRPPCLVALHDPQADAIPPPGFDKLEVLEGRPTLYPCRRFQCQAPVQEPEALRKILDAAPSGQA